MNTKVLRQGATPVDALNKANEARRVRENGPATLVLSQADLLRYSARELKALLTGR